MTNSQLLEADELFSASLSDDDRARLEACLIDLCTVAHKHGLDTYRDCMLHLNAKYIREAEDRAEKELPLPRWFVVEGLGGTS